MSEHRPGTKDWWVETALITMGGVAIAIWLWPAAPAEGPTNPVSLLPEGTQLQPTLADFLSSGCLTAEDLQALRDGRQMRPECPAFDVR